MKRSAPAFSFDDSFNDDDDALFAFEIPEDVPSTSTAPPPPQPVMKPPPPKQAFQVRPSQPVKLNTFKSDVTLSGASGQNLHQPSLSSSIGQQRSLRPATASQIQSKPNGSSTSNQSRPVGLNQSQLGPNTTVQNQQRPIVPAQNQVRPNFVFQNQARANNAFQTPIRPNLGPQNQTRPGAIPLNQPTSTGVVPNRASETSTLQRRSISYQNTSHSNIPSQNLFRPISRQAFNPIQNVQRPVNSQAIHPSKPYFQQAFRPPGDPFPPLPNATKVNIPQPQNSAQASLSSSFQRVSSFPPASGTQKSQNEKPVQPKQAKTSQFPNIPTREQLMQQRAAAAQLQQQRFYATSQQQRFQRPLMNQSRMSGASQIQQRPAGLIQTQQRFMASKQIPNRFQSANQTQQLFMAPNAPRQRQMGPNQTSIRPGQRPLGSFQPNGSNQRPAFPGQSQHPVTNEIVSSSQSPFSMKSSGSTSNFDNLPVAVKDEIVRLKGAVEFLKLRYKSKDRDHNLLAFKLGNEVSSKKDLSSEINSLKIKNDELNQKFINEQKEKASLQVALEGAQAEVEAAKKKKQISPPLVLSASTARRRLTSSSEKVKAGGQLLQRTPSASDLPKGENASNSSDDEDNESTKSPRRQCEPEDILNRLSYRREMEFFVECPDLKKPKYNINEVLDTYRNFFNLKNLERDANGVIIPPPHVLLAREVRNKKKKKESSKKEAVESPKPAMPPPSFPPPDPVCKVPDVPKPTQGQITRTNLMVPPSFRITVPKKRYREPLLRGQTERPIESEEEKKEREIKEKEEDKKKRLLELEKAKARRKLLNITRKVKQTLQPKPAPPPPKFTPILNLVEMAKPRILRPYERKEEAIKRALLNAKAKAAAVAEKPIKLMLTHP